MKPSVGLKTVSIPMSKLDLAAKFSAAIIIGLVILFSIAGTFMLDQQSSTLGDLLNASKDVQTKVLEKQSEAAGAAIRHNVEQLVNLLAHVAPMSMAEMDLTALANYAEQVATGNKSISFVEFLNADGKTFASKGSKVNVDPNNIIEAKVEAEGFDLGKVVVGYNFDSLNIELDSIRKESDANIALMTEAKDNALSSSIINMTLILVAIVVSVLFLTYFMFKVIVQKRLAVLENRLKDIAEGEGDLTKRIEVSGNDAIDRVGKYFNIFLTTVHETITQVVGAIGQLTTASEQMALITEDAKQDVMRQKGEIEQAATAMNEMTATVQEVARNASAASDSAHNADTEAKQGFVVVNETIESINTLAKEVVNAGEVIDKVQEDSHKIGSVLDVIRGVAEQTNLLALNAAIEAARAGDQGRGFAVVSDEVRVLAQRTQQSTQEIQEMIEKLQTGTTNAVEVMEQGRNQAQISVDKAANAGQSLQAITSAVSQITDMNTQIASAAEEQSAVGEEINRNIVSISDVADKSAEGSLSIANSSGELSNLSIDLQGLVGKFKI